MLQCQRWIPAVKLWIGGACWPRLLLTLPQHGHLDTEIEIEIGGARWRHLLLTLTQHGHLDTEIEIEIGGATGPHLLLTLTQHRHLEREIEKIVKWIRERERERNNLFTCEFVNGGT